MNDPLEKREEKIKENIGLVVDIAKNYVNNGLELDDLKQFGQIGLIKAVDRFDEDRGVKFSTYASIWIKKAILQGIQETGYTIRVPAHMLGTLSKFRKLMEESNDKERVIKSGELKATRKTLEKGIQASKRKKEPIEFESIMDKDSCNLIEKEEKEELKKALTRLNEEEQYVLEKLYVYGKTKTEIGKELGVKRQRIYRVEMRAIKTLQRLMN